MSAVIVTYQPTEYQPEKNIASLIASSKSPINLPNHILNPHTLTFSLLFILISDRIVGVPQQATCRWAGSEPS